MSKPSPSSEGYTPHDWPPKEEEEAEARQDDPYTDLPRFGDVAVLPHPYTDQFAKDRRAAVVVSHAMYNQDHCWVMPVTSKKPKYQPGDISIRSPGAAGLPNACTIRAAKIAVLPTSALRKIIGKIDRKTRDDLHLHLENRTSADLDAEMD
jgi:mRNA-degrading endonuclease toxin of MazEF toxin-antitoxin module